MPDISGSYTGQLSGFETCDNGSGPITLNVDLVLNQSGSSFTAEGTGVPEDGGYGEIKLKNGTINNDGTFSATLEGITDSGNILSGSIAGFSNNGELEITMNYSESGGENCSGTVDGTLTGTSGLVFNPEVTPSSTVTNTILNTIQVQSITSDLSTRVGGVLRGGGSGRKRTASGLMFESISGRNAGDGIASYGAWSSYSYSDFDNDLSSTALDGSRHSVLAGVDIAPWESALFGVALGYEYSDIDTRFNRGEQQNDGFTVAPYFGFVLSEILSVDGSLGYSRVNIDQFRTDPGTGQRISSSPTSDRWFATFNMNAFKAYRRWLFGGQLGFLYTRNTQNSFTESNGNFRPEVTNKLGQLHVSGDIAYNLGQFEPFARATYEYDYSLTRISVVGGGPQPANDHNGMVVGLGVRYFSDGGLSGNIEWNRRIGRENLDEDTFLMTIRGEF